MKDTLHDVRLEVLHASRAFTDLPTSPRKNKSYTGLPIIPRKKKKRNSCRDLRQKKKSERLIAFKLH